MISAVLPTYARYDLAFERGEGAYLYDIEGGKHLDFASGIAVTALGHSHPHLVEALVRQGSKLWHTSNLYQVQFGRGSRRMCDQDGAQVS
jgi:acetylornithine/N-succinyldiaminopimelate aminotransferase